MILGLVIMIVQKRRHPGYEPSPYRPGREWHPAGAVQSGTTPEYVDVSDPVDHVDSAAPVTSATAAAGTPA